MKSIIAGAAVLSLATMASPAFAQSAPDPSQVYIESMTYNGTGCPVGSVAVELAPDRTAFTMLFSEFVAQAGPGISPSQWRRNCQINFDLFVPSGWSYSVATVDFRGFVQLDPGVVGTQTATYYFSNQLQQASFDTVFVGPKDQDYLIRDEVGVENLVWSRCGETRPANINTSVRVNNRQNPRGSGMMTTDSIDGQIKQIFRIYWRRC